MTKWIIFITEHSKLFLLITLFAAAGSIYLIRDLNIEAFPDPSPPIIEMVTVADGKSSEEVERQITIPIEVGLAGMTSLERVSSVSLFGLSDIKCKFTYDISYKAAKQEVINRLSAVSLPDGLQPSIIPTMMEEVMRYALVGSNNLMDLRTIQDWVITRYLKTADGVADVGIFGGFVKAYYITVMPQNLVKYGITIGQIADAVSKSNANVGGRSIEKGEQFYTVRGLGLIEDVNDIEKIVVAYKDGKPILVRNLGSVYIGNVPQTGIVGLNRADEVVLGTVLLRKDAKSIPSIRSLHQKIDDLNQRVLPKGLKIAVAYDKWDTIVAVIMKVIELAASGIVLVLIALFIFLGNIRAAVLTAIIIPISLLITFALMSLRDESANLLSIGAIDFGIIADIPIILIEAYFSVTSRLGTGQRSIIHAAREVGRPTLFSVFIILLAFIPIFMMKGAESQIFSPMARTYLYTITFTLILTFSYLFAAKNIFLRDVSESEFGFLKAMRNGYIRLLKVLIDKRITVIAITVITLAIGLFFGISRIGSQFLPKMDEGNVYIRVTFPYSISLYKTYENAKKVRDILLGYPEVDVVEFQVGRPEDATDPTGPYNSEYYVGLKPYNKWRPGFDKERLEESVRDRLLELFPNADINVSQYMEDNLEEVMSGVKGENSIKIFGNDLKELDSIAQEAKAAIDKVPGIVDTGIMRELGQPNYILKVKRDSASALGLSVADVLDTISASLGGKTVTSIIEGEKSFDLILNFPDSYRKDPDAIGSIPIVLPNGGITPLDRVASIRYDTGASFIYRENFKRYIPIKFSVTSKDLGGTVKQAQARTAKIPLPSGYYMVWSGIFNQMSEAFKRFSVSVPAALFFIFATLFILYRSVRNVLITIFAPMIAICAGLLALVITNESLSVSSMVGFISLIGVSILNSSILVSYYIERVSEDLEPAEAVIETARTKFKPVLMGGVVASLGFLPAAMSHGVGCQIQKPIAIVVVGGMSVLTAVVLLIVPLLLKYVDVKTTE